MKKTNETIVVEIKTIGEDKHEIIVNGELYSKAKKDNRSIGQKIINVLYFTNKNNNKIKVIVDGKNETNQFRKEVISKYAGTGLNHFLQYIGA